MFKVWNLFLIIVTFSLSLIGTFLVRSGVLSSVHTFATDPGRGLYILVFLALMLALGFGTLIVRSGKLRSQIEMDSIVSKESVFLFNNLFFLVAAATVFLGTLYPLLVETLKTAKVSVGPPYYNAVFMPVALGLLLMMGIGPTIAWRKASLDNLKRNFMPAALLAVAAAVLAWLIGIRTVFGMAGALVVTFVATTIFVDFGKVSALWARRHETNYLIGFYRGFTNNQRRSAGLVTHLGVLIMVVGIIASTVYQVEKVVSMRIGDVIQLENYSIKMVGLHEVSGANWTAQEGLFEVSKGDRLLSVLKPQKRLYPVSETPTTEAALYTIHLGHIFLTMPEVASDNSVTVRALINPLVLLVWIGGGIMGLGVVLNIFRPRTKASA
jgi:cytochrome c-type biogenesis protein CcmF